MAAYDPDDLKVLFSLFDIDGDGKIAKEEITELVSFISGETAKDDDVTQLMQCIDRNKDGVISIDEFEFFVTKYLRMAPLGIRELFNTFDLDGDGFVNRQEFEQVVKDKADSLHDRKIDFFKKVLTRDDCERVSYQEFLQGALEHYRSYVANRAD